MDMKITVSNYTEQVKQVDFKKLPEKFQKGHAYFQKNEDLYKDSDTIKNVIDTYLKSLNEYLAKQKPAEKKTASGKSGSTEKSKAKFKKGEAIIVTNGASKGEKGIIVRVTPTGKGYNYGVQLVSFDEGSHLNFTESELTKCETAKKTEKKAGKQKKENKAAKPKKSKSKYDNAQLTEKVTEAVRHIKNFITLQGKIVTRIRLLSLIKSLNKAISERLIRKTSKYAEEIEYVQDKLYNWYEVLGDAEEREVEIEDKMYNKLHEIAYSEKKLQSITYIQQYLNIQGKTRVKTAAKELREKIKKAIGSGRIGKNDPYHDKLELILESITKYDKDLTTRPELHEAELNGLLGITGISGCSYPKKKSKVSKPEISPCNTKQLSGVISSEQLAEMEFETIGLTGKYRELIGDPSIGFSCMVYGKPKSGKSTLCIDFARYLAEHHGKVLFCAIEEGYGYTLKEKLERLKAIHPNLYVSDTVPGNLSQFNFVFIDSVSKGKIDNDRLNELIKKHPETALIFIFHSTKNGDFRGGQENAHDVDVIVEIENGIATGRGRFGGYGEIPVNFG